MGMPSQRRPQLQEKKLLAVVSGLGSDTTLEGNPLPTRVDGQCCGGEVAAEDVDAAADADSECPSTIMNNAVVNLVEQPPVAVVEKPCQTCGEVCVERKWCKKCKSGWYCSRSCRQKHAEVHGELCEYIQELEVMERCKQVFSVRESSQVKVKNRLVQLIGERPTLDCRLNNEMIQALWDTGAMVSIVSRDWLKEKIPNVTVMSVTEFLKGDKMHLVAANNTKVGVDGIVILDFRIGDFSTPVPFVVTEEEVPEPIIGYNVIKCIVQTDVDGVPEALKKSLSLIHI